MNITYNDKCDHVKKAWFKLRPRRNEIMVFDQTMANDLGMTWQSAKHIRLKELNLASYRKAPRKISNVEPLNLNFDKLYNKFVTLTIDNIPEENLEQVELLISLTKDQLEPHLKRISEKITVVNDDGNEFVAKALF